MIASEVQYPLGTGEQTMNKQIEEMANDLAKICPDLVENCCGQVNCVTHLTLSLTKLGYRKSTDVAREIFEEIEKFLKSQEALSENKRLKEVGDWIFHDYLPIQLAELKKKYGSEGADDD
jgi:hypothetical protein